MTFLQENPQRFVILPIQHDSIWKRYKNIESIFFTAEDIKIKEESANLLSSIDIHNQQAICNIMSMEEYNQIIQLLMSITALCQIPEARCYFSFIQMMIGIYYEIISIFQHEIFNLRPNYIHYHLRKNTSSFMDQFIQLLILFNNLMRRLSNINAKSEKITMALDKMRMSIRETIDFMYDLYLHHIQEKDKLTMDEFDANYKNYDDMKIKLFTTRLTKEEKNTMKEGSKSSFIFTTNDDF